MAKTRNTSTTANKNYNSIYCGEKIIADSKHVKMN